MRHLLREGISRSNLDKSPLSIEMSRPQSREDWQERNDILERMGCPFRLKLTSQSPYYQIKGTRPFLDGSLQKSSRVHAASEGALDRVFEMCLELKRNPGLLGGQTMARDGAAGWPTLARELEQHILRRGKSTIHTDYERHIRDLALQQGPVTVEKLQKWVETPPPSSRDRRRRLVTAERLMEMGYAIDPVFLKQVKAHTTYHPDKTIEPRDLPTDEQVVAFVDAMPTRTWKTAFGLIATYGLRPHEIFRLHARPDADGWLEVSDHSKTGWRAVMPAHLEWVERWGLRTEELPPFDPEMPHRDLGKRASKQFLRWKRLATWSKPSTYDLRHAYAARLHTHERYENFEPRDCARLMGHSQRVHEKTYLRWVNKDQLKRSLKRRLVAV